MLPAEMIPITWNETANMPFLPTQDQAEGYIEMIQDLNNDLSAKSTRICCLFDST